MARSTLDIILRAIVKGDKDVKKLRDGVKGVGKETERTNAILGAFKKKLAEIGASGMVLFTAKLALNMYESGMAIERARRALIAYTGSAEAADEATRAVMRAGDGLLTRYDAMQNAARLFSMGLARNAQDAARLTKIAIELGTAMGRGPKQAFEDFTLLLSNQSIQRLDTFGLSAAAVRKRIRELQSATAGLDRQTAFLQATLEIASEKLKDLEAAGYDAATGVERARTQLRQWKEDAENNFALGVTGIINGFGDINRAIEINRQRIIASSNSFEEYQYNWNMWLYSLPLSTEMMVRVFAGSFKEIDFEIAKAVEHGKKLVDGWASALIKDAHQVAGAMDDATSSFKDFRLEMGKLDKEMLGRKALQVLQDELKQTGDWQAYMEKAKAVMVKFFDMTPEEAELRLSLSKMGSDLNDHVLDWKTYLEVGSEAINEFNENASGKLGDVADKLDSLTRDLRTKGVGWAEYKQQVDSAIADLPQETKDKIDQMMQAVADGKMSWQDFYQQVSDVIAEIRKLPAHKTSIVTLITEYVTRTGKMPQHGSVWWHSPSAAEKKAEQKGPGGQYGRQMVPGLPYWVGERKPEVFIPRERGRVEPNPQAAPTAAPINVTVYPRDEVDIVSALEMARWLGAIG